MRMFDVLLLDTSTLSSVTSVEGLAVNPLSLDAATLEDAVPSVPQAGERGDQDDASMPTTVLPAVGVIAGVGNVAAEKAVGGSPRSYPPSHLSLPFPLFTPCSLGLLGTAVPYLLWSISCALFELCVQIFPIEPIGRQAASAPTHSFKTSDTQRYPTDLATQIRDQLK